MYKIKLILALWLELPFSGYFDFSAICTVRFWKVKDTDLFNYNA